MTAENIVSFFILIICIAPVIIIGIVQFNSKTPVGFWSGKEPPKKEQITDARAYNRRHGIMWILYGAGLIVCFFPVYFSEGFGGKLQTIILLFFVFAETFGGLLGMIAYHNFLDRKYLKD